jgi:hypothetical protein
LLCFAIEFQIDVEPSMQLDRRDFLNVTLAVAVASALKGCNDDIEPICPFGDQYSDPNSRLTIDVHAHIFNATDLQVKNFTKLVATRDKGGLGKVGQLVAGPLQKFSWAAAPTVSEELGELTRIKPYITDCDEKVITSNLLNLRNRKYDEGKKEIEVAANARMTELAISASDLLAPTAAASPQMMDFRRLTNLPDSYDQLFGVGLSAPADDSLPDASPQAITFRSAIRFVIEMLQYRYVSIYNYLNTYNRSNGNKIDLMLPALVDYDWWLSKGSPTRSSLPDQIKLMKEISILTGGRVHALVPFDPFRQAVFDMGGEAGFSPIAQVENAVEHGGAIGVKLYSPMGFAPFGNKTVGEANPEFWNRSWLAEIAGAPDFGEKLDSAMEKLFVFSSEFEVPVMGHSNESNGPADDFEALTNPDYWRMAAEAFPDARLSFGHFGGAGSQTQDGSSAFEGFLDLMAEDQAAGTSRLAADASYFSNLIDDPDRLITVMRQLFEYGGDNPPVPNRLMYGADWKMLVVEARSENYLRDFARTIEQLERDLGLSALTDKFFGANAAAFMGLKQGQKNRQRLERFYEIAELESPPDWMAKVDALGR